MRGEKEPRTPIRHKLLIARSPGTEFKYLRTQECCKEQDVARYEFLLDLLKFLSASRRHLLEVLPFATSSAKLPCFSPLTLTSDFAEKPSSGEKLGGALLAAPGGVRDASGSRKRLPSRANPARSGFFSEITSHFLPLTSYLLPLTSDPRHLTGYSSRSLFSSNSFTIVQRYTD